MNWKHLLLISLIVTLLFSCEKDNSNVTGPNSNPLLIFRIKLDSTQIRLGELGSPEPVPAGHGSQSPVFHQVAVHYIELSPSAFTPLMGGDVVYNSPRTNGEIGGILFDKLKLAHNGDTVFSIPLSKVTPGVYKYARVSVAYQNYDVKFRAYGLNLIARVACFIGDTVHINSFTINTQTVTINGNKIQGYWAVEIPPVQGLFPGGVIQGQAHVTTVPNVLFSTSPTPPGGCISTGAFPTPLTITGKETHNITVDLSFSINHSVEWTDANGNDVYEPLNGDTIVDMGLRGLIPKVE